MARNQVATMDQLEDELADVRAELAAAKADRDLLVHQFTASGRLRKDAFELADDGNAGAVDDPELPSLDSLMADDDSGAKQHRIEPPPPHTKSVTSVEEMLAPDLMFSEGYAPGQEPPLAAESPLDGNTRLLVTADTEPSIKYPLYKKVITIGRSPEADIVVDCNSVSRMHARLKISDAGMVVEDAGSSNGTKVNGRRVEQALLQDGDELRLGRSRFTFVETG